MHILQKPWAIEFLNTPIQIYNFNRKSQEGGILNSPTFWPGSNGHCVQRFAILPFSFCYHFRSIVLPINKFSHLPFSEYVNLCCLENQIFGQKIQIPEPQVIGIMVSNEVIFLKFQYSFDQKVILAYMHIYETAFQKSLVTCSFLQSAAFLWLPGIAMSCTICSRLFVPDITMSCTFWAKTQYFMKLALSCRANRATGALWDGDL